MIIKEAVYKTKTVKQKVRISDEVYGCDECRKEIKEYPNEDPRLDLAVFKYDNSAANHLHFCSWDCVFKHLPKIKTDYFVNIPYISYDRNVRGKGAKRFLELIKTIKYK